MKKNSKRLISLITTAVVASGLMGSKFVYAATSSGTAIGGKYATNPNGYGKEASITIDGSYSDWSEDMLIAQGLANDAPVKFKGDWENCVIDSYSLYAAWDDENLYVAWQHVNTADICNGQGGALSDGKLGDAHQFIVIDTGSGNNLNGQCTGDQGIWNNQLTFETPVTHVFAMHANGTGTPGIFTSDGTGTTNYTTNCADFDDEGIEFDSGEGCLPKSLMGIYQIPATDEGVAMLYDDSVPAVDLLTKGNHNSSEDLFLEIKIPFTALGITKEEFLANGVGIMQMGLRGESALDCLPHDPSMLDNVFGDYGPLPVNSHEKDDNDVITVPLARAGGKGGIDLGTVNISSFNSNTSSPQKVGKTIEFTTEATGTDGVQYEYSVNNQVVQSYSSSNTFSWRPSIEGNYTISVKVKNGKGKSTSKSMDYDIEKANVNELEINSLSANKKSPQYVGTSINLSTVATGGEGDLSYKYTIKKDSTTVDTRNYSSASSYTWTPDKEGTYNILVEVQDENGNKASDSMNYIIEKEVGEEIEITKFTTNLSSPQDLGKSITLSAAATGGEGTLEYSFIAKGADGSRKEIKAYSTSKTATWTPTKAQKYTLYAKVKDETGEEEISKIAYVIEKNYAINKVVVDKQSPQEAGTAITFTIKATGAKQYRFVAVDSKGAKKVIKNYSSSNKATWTPTAEGTYKIYCKAKDDSGKELQNVISYVVTKPEAIKINSFTTSLASPQSAETAIKLTTKATGINKLYYQYWVLDPNGNMEALSSYSTNASITWKPTIKGDYSLWVDVKDSKGNIKSEFLEYKITAKESTIEDTNSKLSYSGAWKSAKGSKYSGSSMKYINTKGAKVTMKFNGTGIKILSTLSSNRGIAKVIIDGKSYSIDMYSESTKYKAVAFEKLDLSSGTHTITVQYTGLHSSMSKGSMITIDAFKVVEGDII